MYSMLQIQVLGQPHELLPGASAFLLFCAACPHLVFRCSFSAITRMSLDFTIDNAS